MMTLGLDILLLTVDRDLRMVRDRENVGYAMMAADLIELTVARRVQVVGRWTDWLQVIDARPAGEPLLDAALASLGAQLAAGKRLSPVDWMVKQPGRGAVDEGLALLQAQGAVGLYPRRVTSRLTLTEPVLLDQARQAGIRGRLDRFVAAGSAADVLDWALAGLVHACRLWIPGHVDRAADRRYKDAARGERGKDGTDPVEASIRILMQCAGSAHNRDP
ncbi:MAG TPA: GPP34 family phosphoprotein [Streptosporangiaceae bacterium]|jgi:hypothetical protein